MKAIILQAVDVHQKCKELYFIEVKMKVRHYALLTTKLIVFPIFNPLSLRIERLIMTY